MMIAGAIRQIIAAHMSSDECGYKRLGELVTELEAALLLDALERSVKLNATVGRS